MPQDRERVGKAYNAMKSLGISSETVRPVLRRLYKLYDKKWELIEEDNYRTLADAIFEYEEDKLKAETKTKTENLNEDNISPSIKGDPGDEVSSTSRNGKKRLQPDEHEIPRFSGAVNMVESSQSVSVVATSKPVLNVSEAPSESKGMDLVLLNSCHNEENSRDPRASSAIAEKKDKDCSPQFVVPALRTQPGMNNLFHHYWHISRKLIFRQSCIFIFSDSNITSQDSDSRKKQIGSSLAFNLQTGSQTSYDIASSSCGQVRISLTCKHNIWQNNFQFPSPDDILNFAQQFCNAEGSQFSLINLLTEFCESYLESRSVSSKKRPRFNRSTLDCIKKEHPEGHQGKRASSSNKRAVREIADITNGTEKIKISLLDETGCGNLPRFVYSPESLTYESAYVHISLARIPDDDCCKECNGDCLSCSIPCPCARDTGGEFAYTRQGLLSEKFLNSCIAIKCSEEKQPLFYCQDCPLERVKNGSTQEECKGHRYRKFIKECWRKCGCNMECGNRVVQRGELSTMTLPAPGEQQFSWHLLTKAIQVFMTEEGKGWGLRTLEELPKGAFVCEYVGEILTNMELYERNTKSSGDDNRHVYPVLLDADWATEGALKDEEALCLDATHFGNVARFVNHRCFDGNLIEVPVQVETPDRHYYHLAFFTKRKVLALEELNWDYEIDFEDESHPVKAFKCLCGSQYCRDRRR
ncbi:SUVR2 histone-lysine N-methyltransferase [Striga asiatica]|uniref:SUVR2 histone-lysine N-methyltransferase n=1 Tax=Striga asiatica TaxID=4170 RepID=A0A5A7R0V2_STRAF|nr:SUVR2 histone-lysine N-methyltransferase [Striga asiatica]